MNSSIIPTIIEETSKGERPWDIFSRLLNDRIIFLGTAVDDNVANVIVAQLLYLEKESSTDPISLYINSPGGVVTSGLAIYDTMNFISAPVHTICMGQACSMGAFLLAAGEKGCRKALPNARVMVHQPLGGASGQASDIEIKAQEIIRLKKFLNQEIANNTGQKYEDVECDTDRDYFMTAAEALSYGIIDSIITNER
jgi:ATP-dependent Clp protease, protease subunit